MDLQTALNVALGVGVLLLLLIIRRRMTMIARQREEAEIQQRYEEQTRKLTKEMSESSRNLFAEQQKYNGRQDDELVDQSIEAKFNVLHETITEEQPLIDDFETSPQLKV